MAKNRRQVDVVDPASDRQGTRHDYAQCWKGWGSPDKVWVGFFIDWETGLAWVKGQPDPKAFTLNNVPPARAMGGNGRGKPKRERKHVPIPVRPVQETAAVTEDVKALRQDAEVLLDQHRADEAAELAQEGDR